jgi:ATP-dependent Lon protease
MRDEAEIKGHRRTYVGAMPGKILQGLKIVGSRAPVFMIDEIDKLGMSYQGDPSSALLEVLDPEQNVAFRDHYLDLPFDLSHVVFVATANTVDSIPRPLLDRMEMIRLSGYIVEEKAEIAKRFLIPKSLKKHGIKRGQIRYNKTALKAIADGYARDAGMRTFEKAVDRIHRKVARTVVNKKANLPVRISADTLETYLKKPVFREDGLKKAASPGMALGLAWTSMGGDVLVIEATAVKGKGAFKLTGQMGDVMKESAGIALTTVRGISENLGIPSGFFEKNALHLHIPEGATPKDGPSAGITMATALLSLVTEKKIKSSLAMTGELSLTGKVLPIGGLKEKTIAARRHKLKEIIIPEANLRDLEEIPEHVKKGIAFHPVTEFRQVIALAIPALRGKIATEG